MLFRGKYLVKVLAINEPCKEIVRGSYVILGNSEYEIELRIEPFMEFRREFCLIKCEGKVILSEDCRYVGEVYWVKDAKGLWKLIQGKKSEEAFHLILALITAFLLYSLLSFIKSSSFWTATAVLLLIFLVMMDLSKLVQYLLVGYVKAS
ncbi:hypothetical protein A3L04_06735 [Thermococcus chitonophagus]|uniref:Uncharacterized protein n=1 Tax=Thermococcus chitonophagus TaxID=54262 RepID=A0A170SP26_9EURY|nr:hypothetical protein [Thermococcus chitonophagus]ASJ16792.1 hypothetical protein A3L04_06735 [Thermococcus chitonophagus]CUX78264.1 hypothetical protein CHITON_1485 [Thermococcus chitonophagus]